MSAVQKKTKEKQSKDYVKQIITMEMKEMETKISNLKAIVTVLPLQILEKHAKVKQNTW